jgi:hypothetical protein
MAKYYSIEEVQEKLALNEDRIRQLVQTGQLHQYRDAGKIVFPAEEVDSLASKQGTGEITLEPVDEEAPAEEGPGEDVISLEEVEDIEAKGGTRAGAKDDTVITSVGISVFDDDELPTTADPMAKTQISKQADEPEIPLESIGSSGSGLLDLTRESDDTSLGAELLDEIYPEEEETISEEPIVAAEPEADAGMPLPSEPQAAAPVMMAPAAAIGDPAGPVFTGLAVVSVLLLGLVGVVSAAVVQGVWPGFLDLLYHKSLFVLIGAVVLALVAALVGWMVGRRAAAPVPRPAEPE